MRIMILTVLATLLLWSSASPAQERATVSADRANLRASASVEAAIVTTLSRGAVVTVVERSGGWARVSVGEKSGWMRSSLLAGGGAGAAASVQGGTPVAGATATRGRGTDAPTPVAETRSAPQTAPDSSSALSPESWEYRDPEVAKRYALFAPGGGQLYTGEYVKGGALLGGSIIVFWTGLPKLVSSGNTCSGGFLIVAYVKCAPLNTGIIIAALVYGILDADDSASRMNQKRSHSSAMSRARVEPLLVAIPGQSVQYGIAIQLR